MQIVKVLLSIGFIFYSCDQCRGCSVSSTSSVAFGGYIGPAAKTTTGSITVNCTSETTYTIDLLAGNSGTFGVRHLTSGANTLHYNLYTDGTHTTIWGDGLLGTSNIQNTAAGSTVHTVYGRILPGQTPASGNYDDSITVVVTY